MEDWKKVYSTDKMYKVNILKALLAEENIETREISTKDSMFPIGGIEIYVDRKHLAKAQEIIENHQDL
ncbi:MAG: DUF2007 domain-containing protein [Bacteroidales bacterium]|nr:DUF2007 domain-containing protein [Bacteroidales bacterium]MCF8377507.1 DUF2007 domain-containing protein [Bacteroidales bacterium]MCF8401630.1 DUF2007 domain-containing protein [Bacteroidales bacterium]